MLGKTRILRLVFAAILIQIGWVIQADMHFQVVSLGYGDILMKHGEL